MIEQLLAESVICDPETGSLTWRLRPYEHFVSEAYARRWNAKYAGKPAFASVNGAGYRHGAIAGKHLLAHRVVWFLSYGDWPDDEVDHINGDRLDNRIANLRDVSHAKNAINSAPMAGRKSKYKGVTQTAANRWGAYCNRKWLGTFACETAALIARIRAEREDFGEYRRLHYGTI